VTDRPHAKQEKVFKEKNIYISDVFTLIGGPKMRCDRFEKWTLP